LRSPADTRANFLVPRGLAVEVTRGRMKEIEEQKKVLEVKAARQREQVQGVADKMAGAKVVIKARCSATGKLFGSITNRQVASVMEEQTGEEIDRHKIVIDDRIRSVGHYHATIKLHPDVEFDVEFEVEGEGLSPRSPRRSRRGVESAEVQAEDAAEPEPAQETEAAASEAELEIAAETEDSGE